MKVRSRQKNEKLQIEPVKLARDSMKVRNRQKSEKFQIQPVQLARETLKVKTRQKGEKLQIEKVKLASDCESQDQAERRKAADRESKARKNHPHNSLTHLIDSFIVKTKQGPDYVCTSCHRVMYK